jgi:nitroreductase
VIEFDEVIRKRKIIREFDLERQIPNEIIRNLINNAHRVQSLSSTHSGPGFIIVKDDLIKSTLRKAEANKEYVEKAPILIVLCSNTSSIAYFSKWGISS